MANKFNPQGRSKVLWVKTIADVTKPTETELDTGTSGVIDLTCGIRPDGISGFSTSPTDVDASTMCSTAEETVPGLPTTDSGSLQMTRASTSGTDNSALFDDVLALRNSHEEGYVVFAFEGWNEDANPPETGPQDGDLVDIFPAEVSSVNPDPLAGGSVATYTVGFSHPNAFTLNVEVDDGL